MIQAVEEQQLIRGKFDKQNVTRLDTLKQGLVYLKRSNLVHQLPVAREAAIRILEVGCLEEYTLQQFANHFVNAQIVGLERSPHWIEETKNSLEAYNHRLDFLSAPYTEKSFPTKKTFDVLLFSYQFSKSYVPWEEQIQQAYEDLKPGGLIVVLDFYAMPNKLLAKRFKKKQRIVQPRLLGELEDRFVPLSFDIYKAYFGLWKYFSFVGIRPMAS